MSPGNPDQRYYASAYGRFNTVDPFGGSVRPNSPSSWNRYAYALGDPINGNDPQGLEDYSTDCDDDATCGVDGFGDVGGVGSGFIDLSASGDSAIDTVTISYDGGGQDTFTGTQDFPDEGPTDGNALSSYTGFPTPIPSFVFNVTPTGQFLGTTPVRPPGSYWDYASCFVGAKVSDWTGPNASAYLVGYASIFGFRAQPLGKNSRLVGLVIVGAGIFTRDRQLATGCAQATNYTPLALQGSLPLPRAIGTLLSSPLTSMPPPVTIKKPPLR